MNFRAPALTIIISASFFCETFASQISNSVISQGPAPYSAPALSSDEWKSLVASEQYDEALKKLALARVSIYYCSARILKAAAEARDQAFFKKVIDIMGDKIYVPVVCTVMKEAARRNWVDHYRELCRVMEHLKDSGLALRIPGQDDMSDYTRTRWGSLIEASGGGCFELVHYELQWRKKGNFDLNREARDTHGIAWWDRKKEKFRAFKHNGFRKLRHSLPLVAAVDGNQRDVALLLLQKGADPEKPDYNGDTALSLLEKIAITDNSVSDLLWSLKLYIQYKSRVTSINLAISDHQFTRKLIMACPALASIFIKDQHGNTLLHKAVLCQDIELINQLLVLEPQLCLEKNNVHLTPIMLAIAKAKQTALRTFIVYAYKCCEQDNGIISALANSASYFCHKLLSLFVANSMLDKER